MIIYGALLIPFIAAVILFKFYSKNVVWWEFFIPLLFSLIFIYIMKFTIEKVQVSSKEYWGSFINRVEYYEPWNEYIHQTCTRSCCCDGKGQNCSTETYDCSYVDYHAAQWQIVCTNGEVITISKSEYNAIKQKFNNEQFAELNRKYYTQDGNEFYCTWSKDSINAIPVTTLHHYENRIKAADQSIFHLKKITEADIKKYSLKSYPGITGYYKMPAVIGDSSEDALIADKKLQYANGLLGPKKEVRIFVLVYKNQPIYAGLYQEWYWSGANMNEFVICIGIDNDRNVKWCNTISWTRNETLKVTVKNFVQAQPKLNLQAVAEYTQTQVDKQFTRRNFKEFSYLTVEPPTWSIILTYVLTILMNVGISYWVIKNNYQ